MFGRVWLLTLIMCGCAPFTAGWVAPPSATKPEHVFITSDLSAGRESKVVAVLDFHSPADSEDKAFEALRARAAELGADAVIGAEFEHGEDGGLSHLSGMAVTYYEPDTRPFDVLGEIDITTPEDAEDKGLDQLQARAWAMGANEIRDIHFEHGEEGGSSHLRGVAVLHRDP